MNNFEKLFLVTAIHAEMKKEAMSLLERGAGLLGRGAEGLESRIPNSGFTQGVGRLAMKAAPQLGASDSNWLIKALVGSKPLFENSTVPLGQLGEHMEGQLGRRLLSRGAVGGAAAGTAGALGSMAVQAPGRFENNQRFEQQQAHPLRSWLAQHLAGKPKLQHQNYLNPL
jgi:hypothetical protein